MFNSFRKVYEENPKIPARKVVEPIAELNKDGEPKEPLHDKPFKPSQPSKKGVIKGTLEKFPTYCRGFDIPNMGELSWGLNISP